MAALADGYKYCDIMRSIALLSWIIPDQFDGVNWPNGDSSPREGQSMAGGRSQSKQRHAFAAVDASMRLTTLLSMYPTLSIDVH